MKKTISLLVMLAVIFSCCFAYADAPIYSLTKETKYIDGLEVKNIRTLTNSGWLNINIATADLTKDYIDICLLKDKEDIRKLNTVKALSEQNDTHIAVNGDFFSWSSAEKGMGSSVGVEIKDGELLTSYSRASTEQAVFMKDNDKNMLMDYIDTYMTITAPNGEGEVIKHINKYDDLSGIVLYDKNWGDKSPGSVSFQVEMVVEDGKVKSINYDLGPADIPENGYVLSFLKDRTTFLIDNFNIGDEVKLDMVVKPDYENINLAMGGGTLLVKDGKVAPNTHNISGLNPRTALGLDKDGKILYLITIDGRQKESVGLSLKDLSELLINNGIYTAINLDGGGSTTMVAKDTSTGENKVVNMPSQGSLRSVINAIGVKMTKEKEEVSYITIEADRQNVFLTESANITVTAYDKNNQNLGIINADELSFECTSGKVENGVFYPDSIGDSKVTATYKEQNASIDFKIFKNIDIEKMNEKKEITPSSTAFSFTVMGNTSPKNTLGEMGIIRKLSEKSSKKGYELALFTGTSIKNTASNIKTLKSDAFESYEYKNCTFISINNKGASICDNGINQWTKFLNTIDGTKNKNIFILLTQKPDFSSTSEQDLYNDIVNKYLFGKNVFVIYSGDNEAYTKNGVTYFGVKGLEDMTVKNILDTNHVVFTVDGNNVNYYTEKIIEK